MERVLKVEKTTETDQHEVLIQTISIEHNYASALRPITEDDRYGSIVRNLKQEEINVQIKPKHVEQQEGADSEPVDAVMIDQESSVEQLTQTEIIGTEYLMEKCSKCQYVFESTSLNYHMRSVHYAQSVPKTKICPICTAHCRTIYHYFIHRSKYHNWSKPRHRCRPKRKLQHYKCSECTKMFLSKFAFDNHRRYSCASLRFKCSICHLEFSSGMSMLIHKRICKVLMAKVETVDCHAKVNRRLKMNSNRKEERHGQSLCQQTPTRPAKLVSRFHFPNNFTFRLDYGLRCHYSKIFCSLVTFY